MTKHRSPLTFDAALARVAGQVPGGFAALAKGAPRSYAERTVRNWGDPDTPEAIPIDVALHFDMMFAEAGGDGSPFLESFVHQREQAELAYHSARIQLGKHAAEVIRECGEAGSALVTASQPGASPNDRARALKECTEAFEILRQTLPLLTDDAFAGEPLMEAVRHLAAEAQPP